MFKTIFNFFLITSTKNKAYKFKNICTYYNSKITICNQYKFPLKLNK